MARMIPSTIHPSVRSAAERKLFAVIENAPGSEAWVCLHSLGLARHATKRRGEIDFLLLTSKGIFVLEVKGGQVWREGGVWRFKDRYGVIHEKNEGPFDQASSAMFTLEKEVRQHFEHDDRSSQLLFGFGVVCPDILFDVKGTEADQRQVYDSRDRRQPITRFIDRLAAYWRERTLSKRYAPKEKDIEALVDFLRGDFDLLPPLGLQADAVAEQLLSLEREQYAVLDALEQFSKPRIVVQGGAGTGKTLLAVEAAKREARRGEGDILLLCYNRLLASFLDANVKTEHLKVGQIAVKSIYSLLNDLIASSPLAEEFKQKCASVDQGIVYSALFPEYAPLALLENEITPYRTVIIDEAQDMMNQELLDVIDVYVEGGFEAGRWWVFCDINNQASVFGVFDENALFRLMDFGQVLILPTNRRNTKPVANETAMLTRPKIRTKATVDGIPVKYTWYETPKAQLFALRRILDGLLAENVVPSRITVLSPRKAEDCCAASVAELPLVHLTQHNVWKILTGACDSISYCSVSSFKGLENDFIILTDIEDLNSDWWRSVIYVGMSRTRFGLHMLLYQSLRSTYDQQLRRWLEEQGTTITL